MLTPSHMRQITLAFLLLLTACALHAESPVKLTDEQLRTQIVGVWYFEVLPDLKQQIAERVQYFPGGKFVADYRISGPGSEKYLRALGTWKIEEGKFSETSRETSDPAIKFPTFTRQVLAIDARHMILVTSDGTRAELWRGKAPLEDGKPTVSSLDQKKFFEELMAMHLSGWRSVPAGDGKVSFRLDSRIIEDAAHK